MYGRGDAHASEGDVRAIAGQYASESGENYADYCQIHMLLRHPVEEAAGASGHSPQKPYRIRAIRTELGICRLPQRTWPPRLERTCSPCSPRIHCPSPSRGIEKGAGGAGDQFG